MKYNFAERIKIALTNFGPHDRDDDQIAGDSKDKLEEYKASLLNLPPSDPQYKVAFKNIISSHNNISAVATDNEFMNEYKDKSSKGYNALVKYADMSASILEASQNDKMKSAIKGKAFDEATDELAGAVTSQLESPAKEFYEGMFKMIKNIGLNISKLRAIKNDKTDFEKELNEAMGDENGLQKASAKAGVEQKSAAEVAEEQKEISESSSSSGSSGSAPSYNEADFDIDASSESDVRKMGEAMAKKMFKEDYDQDKFDAVLEHGKKTVGDDPSALAAYIRNVYRGATEMDFTQEMNFSERIASAFINFSNTYLSPEKVINKFIDYDHYQPHLAELDNSHKLDNIDSISDNKVQKNKLMKLLNDSFIFYRDKNNNKLDWLECDLYHVSDDIFNKVPILYVKDYFYNKGWLVITNRSLTGDDALIAFNNA